MFKSDLTLFERNFELELDDWCASHYIDLSREQFEDEFEFQERVIQYIKANKQYQLLDELRELLGIGKFAFAHEETALKDSYLKITDNI